MFGLRQRTGSQDPESLTAELSKLSTKDGLRALTRRSRLAGALVAQERWDVAEAGYRRLVDDQARILGARHRCTLASRTNLAVVLAEQNRFDESLALLVDTIRDYGYVWGHDHELTLCCRANFARVLHNWGKFAEAADVFAELVDVSARQFGDRDARTLGARLELSTIARTLAKLDDAERLAEMVLSHARPGSPCRFAARIAMARIASDRAEHEVAVLALRELLAGSASPEADQVRPRLATALTAAGEYAEAVELWRSVVTDFGRTQGAQRRDTLCARHGLASALVEIGRVDEAELEARAALEGLRRPPVHLCTLACRKVLARVALVRGDRCAAIDGYEELVEGYRALLGEDHPYTREARAALDDTQS